MHFIFHIFLLQIPLWSLANGIISGKNYRPKVGETGVLKEFVFPFQGNNPLLYEPGVDPIVHLDADTFADTVLRPDKERAYLVEFYKDW